MKTENIFGLIFTALIFTIMLLVGVIHSRNTEIHALREWIDEHRGTEEERTVSFCRDENGVMQIELQ